MRYVATFDPTASTSGSFDIGSANPGDKVLLTNLSAVNILLNFEDGSTDVLHAGQANYWVLENITPQIEWEQSSVLPVAATPTICNVVLYNADEPLEGNYPTSLIYFTIVANPAGVNTNVSGTGTDLINDGQVVGHTFIESTPVGQTQSSFTLTNNGLLALKTLIAGTYHTAITTQATGNGLLLSQTGDTVEVQGSATIDQVLTVMGTSNFTGSMSTGAITVGGAIIGSSVINFQVPASSTVFHINSGGPVLDANLDANGKTINHCNVITDTSGANWVAVTAGATTRLQSAGTIALQVPGGSTQFSVNSTDVASSLQFTAPKFILGGTTGQYNGYVGGFSRIDTGTFTSNQTTNQSVPHNLGATPTWAFAFSSGSTSTTTLSVVSSSSTALVVSSFANGVPCRYVAWRN